MSLELAQRCNQLLNEYAEPQLRALIEAHGLGRRLIAEDMMWVNADDKIRFHKGDLEDYKFEKMRDSDAPWGLSLRRAIRWQGRNRLLYHVEIFANESMKDFTLACSVGRLPFGERLSNIDRLYLPLEPDLVRQHLERKYKLLCPSGDKNL